MIRVLTIVATLCLAACVTSYKPPRQFDLGDYPAPAQQSGVLAANFIIPNVTQPSWMRSRDIFYRMDYESPARPKRYTLSQWVAPPGEMVTMRLREAVRSANIDFTLPAANGASGYLLQTDLDEFTQVFMTTTGSQCIVQLRASLWRADGRIMAQREFRLEIPAPTADASGAARCLATAVDREDDDIVQWLALQVPPR
jgi:cholesterol transport system auxiliary component